MKKIIALPILILNIVVAVLLLLSTLSGHIAPSSNGYITILSYGYLYLLLANVVFVLLWLFFGSKKFLLSLIVIVARYTFIPLYIQMGGTTELADDADTTATLRIMTFNSHGFLGVNDSLNADSGATAFLQIVKEETPDVMCLQEFLNAPHVKVSDSLASLGYGYNYCVHSSLRSVVLFSKYPIIDTHNYGEIKKFYADIEKDSLRLRLFCVHLTSYQMIGSDAETIEKLTHGDVDSSTRITVKKLVNTARMHETEWNTELKPLVEDSPYPVVVAGDFNDPPASYIYQQARNILNDAYTEKGCGFCTTYHGPFPAFRIDYVLHSESLKTLSYKRIKSNISDHFPIVVDLQFKK